MSGHGHGQVSGRSRGWRSLAGLVALAVMLGVVAALVQAVPSDAAVWGI